MIIILSIVEARRGQINMNLTQDRDNTSKVEQNSLNKSEISNATTETNNHEISKLARISESNIRLSNNLKQITKNNFTDVKCDKCHDLAHCIWPGICQCPPGYEGNGIQACKIPTPYSFQYKLGRFAENSTVYMNVSYTGVSSKFNITQVFCKIGNMSLPAINFGHQYAICNTTYSKHGLEISLSFDNIHFGEGIVIGNSFLSGWFSFIGIGLGIIIGIAALILLFTTKSGPLAKKDEVIPLTRDINRSDDFNA